jgi:SAM-dependent methyltransferase
MSIEARYYGDTAKQYDAKRQTTRTHRDENTAFDTLLAKAGSHAELRTVLDLPCGTGRWIARLQKANLDYCGVDISADMLRQAAKIQPELPSGSLRLVEASWLDFLPSHAKAFDLVVSTRFINWWNENEGAKLVHLLCDAARFFAILHVRVDETIAQRALSTALRYPNRLRKAFTDRERRKDELARLRALFSGSQRPAHPYISYHRRERLKGAVSAAGFSIAETVVIRRHAYGNVEFWLVRRDRA